MQVVCESLGRPGVCVKGIFILILSVFSPKLFSSSHRIHSFGITIYSVYYWLIHILTEVKQKDVLSVPVPVPGSDYIRHSPWCFLDSGCYNKSMKVEYTRIVVNDFVFWKELV